MSQVLYSSLLLLFSGAVCGVTSYIIADYRNLHRQFRRRLEYALISAFGSMAICYFAAKYYPDKFSLIDAPAMSVLIGLFGIGRVLCFVANKVGLPLDGDSNE